MNKKLKYISVFLCLLILSGCLVTPARDHDNTLPPDCKLITRKIKLKMTVIDSGSLSGCNEPECALAVIAPVVVSGVVSTSIMIVNNTIHWIEKEGACDDGSIKKTVESIKGAIKKSGGWVVDSMDKLLKLLKTKSLKNNQDKNK